MKGWLLILLIQNGLNAPMTESVGPFESKAACERAAAEFMKQADKVSAARVVPACVAQGDE